MSTLVDVERAWRDLLLAREERLPFDAADADPVRQRLYRRLVRANLSSGIRRAVPILRKLAGDGAVDALIARFLDEVGARTRLARFVALEFGSWALELPHDQLPHPCAGELTHWEALEIDVVTAPDAPADADGAAAPLARIPALAAAVVVHPSTRLTAYRHAVHRLTTSSTTFPPAASADTQPTALLAWRSAERFTYEALSGGLAKVLVETAGSGATLGDAYARVEATLQPGDTFERPRVNAALVDLCRRGALLGFAPPPPR